MKQYIDLLKNIISNGVEKESGRPNMPKVIGLSNATITMNLREGFPLLTTKKMYFKGIVHELLWFIKGDTNIKYLIDNNVNIWNNDALRWYKDVLVKNYQAPDMDMVEFIELVKQQKKYYYTKNVKLKDNIDLENNLRYESCVYIYGDMGKIYGHQWRYQNGVDQLKYVYDNLKNNPYSRYHIINNWNPSDLSEMGLPPCHLLYQFIVRPLSLNDRLTYYYNNMKGDLFLYKNDDNLKIYLKNINVPEFYLDLNMYQRSADVFLGLPFNLASMSLLLEIFAKSLNMISGVATWIGGDTHIYIEHLSSVLTQLDRNPYALPKLKINKKLNSFDDIISLEYDDFELVDYLSHEPINAKLFTGLS